MADKSEEAPNRENKKHPCPDCKMCQWCSDSRCELCRGWLVKPSRPRCGKDCNCTDKE